MSRHWEVVDLGPESDRELQVLVTDLVQTRAAYTLALEYGDQPKADLERSRLRLLELELTNRRRVDQVESPARLEALDAIARDPGLNEARATEILDQADADELGDLPIRDVVGQPGEPLVRIAGMSGAILSVGQCLVLSGAGGTGKSTLALQLLLGAAAPGAEEWRDALGFSLRRGPFVYACYEDSPPVLRDRAVAVLGFEPQAVESIPVGAYVAYMVGRPLYGPATATPYYDAVPGRLPAWSAFWRRVRARIEEGRKEAPGPGYVVLDPAAEAYVGDDLRTAAVRQFIDASCIVCRALGMGLVIVAHPSKIGVRRGTGADVIAGTAGWHDAARGVISFRRDVDEWTVTVEKANYGPRGKPWLLTRDGPGPFRLWEASPAPAAVEPVSQDGCPPHAWTIQPGDVLECADCSTTLALAGLGPLQVETIRKGVARRGDEDLAAAIRSAWLRVQGYDA